MKKLMLSTAILAASAISSAAQDATSPFWSEADPMALTASDFTGMRVYAAETALDGQEYDGIQEGWQDIGEINDVVLTREGEVQAVLVDIGGFLGIGERQVAVNMDAIQFVSDAGTADNAGDFFLVMTADRATLEGAPEYTTSSAGDAAMTEGSDIAAAPAEPMAEDTASAAEDPAAGTTADPATETAEDNQTGDPQVVPDMSTEAGEPATDMATREPIVRDGYDALDMAALTAEDLTGARVYDANDDWIGEIGELVLSEDGQISQAVVDVGGFLGMGEKPVALPLEQMDILRQADGTEMRVYVSMTKEELESMPAYGS